jgi:hypothetical protein
MGILPPMKRGGLRQALRKIQPIAKLKILWATPTNVKHRRTGRQRIHQATPLAFKGPVVLTFLLYAGGFLFRQKKKSEANPWATRQSEESNTFDTKVPLVLSAADESP